MLLTKELVEKFQTLHLTKYKTAIGYEVAEAQLKELAELVRLTCKTEEHYERV